MPRGPKGEKRPADVVASAHKVFQITIGEDTDDIPSVRRRSELAGAATTAKALSGADRKAIAKMAASARWNRDHSKGAK